MMMGGGDLPNLKWCEFRIGDLFDVKSNPQLNKNSFIFNEYANFPYFTRTCLNNGISGYVEYLDEEHKIKGNSIAVGMLGMKFFYMEKDFYAGQFTKTIYAKFNFDKIKALFFTVLFNKFTKILKGILVRDFEKTFLDFKILLPCDSNVEIAFDFIESFINAIQKEIIKDVVSWNEKKLQTYNTTIKPSNY